MPSRNCEDLYYPPKQYLKFIFHHEQSIFLSCTTDEIISPNYINCNLAFPFKKYVHKKITVFIIITSSLSNVHFYLL